MGGFRNPENREGHSMTPKNIWILIALAAGGWVVSQRSSGFSWPTILGPNGISFGTPTTRQWGGKPVGFMSGSRYTPERKALAAYAMVEARDLGIPPEGFAFQLWVESRYNANIESPVGALGIAQMMPLTGESYGLVTGVTPELAAEYKRKYKGASAEGKKAAAHWLMAQPGVQDNRNDARASIRAGALYMKRLYEKFGNWAEAVGAYNCGAGCMGGRLRRGTSVPQETQNYISAIAPYYHSTPKPHLVGPEVRAKYPWPARA